MRTFLLAHLGTMLGILLGLLLLSRMVQERRPSQSSIAWLLAIVLVPYLGIPLYLALGGRKLRGARARKNPLRRETAPGREPEGAGPVDRLLRGFGLPGASGGHRVTLLGDGEEAFSALSRLLEEARESIEITVFILHPDEVGKLVLDQLARRAASGVRVTLLLDGLGSFHTRRSFLAPLVEAGGEVAFFLPLLLPQWRSRANLRNHRKIVVVDGRIALAGGINIAGEYLGPTPRSDRWRDLAFLVEGPAVRHFAELVRSDWEFATAPQAAAGRAQRAKGERSSSKPGGTSSKQPAEAERSSSKPEWIQVLPSGPDVPGDPLHAALLAAFFAARERIRIVTPYFVPDDALQESLAIAARRGVDLTILLPARSNHRLADLSRGRYLRDLQEAGARVALYLPGMVHAKAVLVDDELAMIGSANLDQRSLFLDHEVMMVAYGGPVAADLATWLSRLERDAEIGVRPAGFLGEIGEGAARLVGPLL